LSAIASKRRMRNASGSIDADRKSNGVRRRERRIHYFWEPPFRAWGIRRTRRPKSSRGRRI